MNHEDLKKLDGVKWTPKKLADGTVKIYYRDRKTGIPFGSEPAEIHLKWSQLRAATTKVNGRERAPLPPVRQLGRSAQVLPSDRSAWPRLRQSEQRFKHGVRAAMKVCAILAALALAACQTADPSAPRPTTQAQAQTNRFAQALIVSVPPGADKAPVVLLLEGNDGSSRMHPTWGPFLTARGIAVVQIQSARARGRANWQGTGCQLQYAEDPRAVVAYLKDWPGIDASRFAVMGFSRGGTEALGGAPHFVGAESQPAAVFAFYPGCSGACPSDWSRLAPQVPVHVFYGSADSWGAHMNTIGACRALARSGVAYHEYPGAPHGFDAPWRGAFVAGGGRHVYAPDAQATAAAQAVVAETLARAWGTPR